MAKCEQVGYQSPLWSQRYPRLAKVMDQNPLMPLGNSIQNNILIGCKKPFAISKGVEEEWLDRDNNPEWSLKDVPLLAGEGSDAKTELAELPTLWQKVPGFEPIPYEKIGPKGM